MSWEISLIKPGSSPIPVVVGILKRNNTILVAQRAFGKSYGGYWEFPGGKIEPNESSRDALQRELKEELDIDVINAHFLFSYTHTYPERTVLLEVWLVTQFSGEPYGRENQILHWATMTELSQWQLLEGNKTIIEKINSQSVMSPPPIMPF